MFDNKLKARAAFALIGGLVGTIVLAGFGIVSVYDARQGVQLGTTPGYTSFIVLGAGGLIGFAVPLVLQALDKLTVARWWCVVFAVLGFGLSFGLNCVAIVGTVLFATAAYYLQSHQAAYGLEFDEVDDGDAQELHEDH